MIVFNGINWLNSFISFILELPSKYGKDLFFCILSALISTILAYGLSKYFYNKSNRDAFYMDVVFEIYRADPKEKYKAIKEAKERYSYRYGRPKEKKCIEKLLIVCNEAQKHSFEKAFTDAIFDYYYKIVGYNKNHHLEYVDSIDEYIEVPNEHEPYNEVKRLADLCNSDEAESTLNEKLSELLTDFYNAVTPEGEKIDLFKDRSAFDIFFNSNQYKEYKKCDDKLKKSIEEFNKFFKNGKLSKNAYDF